MRWHSYSNWQQEHPTNHVLVVWKVQTAACTTTEPMYRVQYCSMVGSGGGCGRYLVVWFAWSCIRDAAWGMSGYAPCHENEADNAYNQPSLTPSGHLLDIVRQKGTTKTLQRARSSLVGHSLVRSESEAVAGLVGSGCFSGKFSRPVYASHETKWTRSVQDGLPLGVGFIPSY